MTKSPRPSLSVFAYCKQSNTGGGNKANTISCIYIIVTNVNGQFHTPWNIILSSTHCSYRSDTMPEFEGFTPCKLTSIAWLYTCKAKSWQGLKEKPVLWVLCWAQKRKADAEQSMKVLWDLLLITENEVFCACAASPSTAYRTYSNKTQAKLNNLGKLAVG